MNIVATASGSSSHQSRAKAAEYVACLREAFLGPACVQGSFGPTDERLAAALHGEGLPTDTNWHAILLGCGRKSLALLARPVTMPVCSLAYFEPLLCEVEEEEFSLPTGSLCRSTFSATRSIESASLAWHAACPTRFGTGRPTARTVANRSPSPTPHQRKEEMMMPYLVPLTRGPLTAARIERHRE